MNNRIDKIIKKYTKNQDDLKNMNYDDLCVTVDKFINTIGKYLEKNTINFEEYTKIANFILNLDREDLYRYSDCFLSIIQKVNFTNLIDYYKAISVIYVCDDITKIDYCTTSFIKDIIDLYSYQNLYDFIKYILAELSVNEHFLNYKAVFSIAFPEMSLSSINTASQINIYDLKKINEYYIDNIFIKNYELFFVLQYVYIYYYNKPSITVLLNQNYNEVIKDKLPISINNQTFIEIYKNYFYFNCHKIKQIKNLFYEFFNVTLDEKNIINDILTNTVIYSQYDNPYEFNRPISTNDKLFLSSFKNDAMIDSHNYNTIFFAMLHDERKANRRISIDNLFYINKYYDILKAQCEPDCKNLSNYILIYKLLKCSFNNEDKKYILNFISGYLFTSKFFNITSLLEDFNLKEYGLNLYGYYFSEYFINNVPKEILQYFDNTYIYDQIHTALQEYNKSTRFEVYNMVEYKYNYTINRINRLESKYCHLNYYDKYIYREDTSIYINDEILKLYKNYNNFSLIQNNISIEQLNPDNVNYSTYDFSGIYYYIHNLNSYTKKDLIKIYNLMLQLNYKLSLKEENINSLNDIQSLTNFDQELNLLKNHSILYEYKNYIQELINDFPYLSVLLPDDLLAECIEEKGIADSNILITLLTHNPIQTDSYNKTAKSTYNCYKKANKVDELINDFLTFLFVKKDIYIFYKYYDKYSVVFDNLSNTKEFTSYLDKFRKIDYNETKNLYEEYKNLLITNPII